jgi:hypothetical protein
MQTDIIGVTIGIIGIVIGIAVSYYFYKKSIRIKEPVYSIKSNNLISGNVSTFENLNISYKDYRVQNVTVSKILFYNRGAETITLEDTQTDNRVRIIAKEDVKILDASILQTNFSSNHFWIPSTPLDYTPASEGKEALISFKYLDKNHGAVYQVIHTGTSSENIGVAGDIMGVQAITEVSPDTFTPPPKPVAVIRAIFVWFIVVAAITSMMIVSGMLRTSKEIEISFYGAIIFFALLEIVRYIFKLIREQAFPKGLEKFLE